jgi:hypothetical protein
MQWRRELQSCSFANRVIVVAAVARPRTGNQRLVNEVIDSVPEPSRSCGPRRQLRHAASPDRYEGKLSSHKKSFAATSKNCRDAEQVGRTAIAVSMLASLQAFDCAPT